MFRRMANPKQRDTRKSAQPKTNEVSNMATPKDEWAPVSGCSSGSGSSRSYAGSVSSVSSHDACESLPQLHVKDLSHVKDVSQAEELSHAKAPSLSPMNLLQIQTQSSRLKDENDPLCPTPLSSCGSYSSLLTPAHGNAERSSFAHSPLPCSPQNEKVVQNDKTAEATSILAACRSDVLAEQKRAAHALGERSRDSAIEAAVLDAGGLPTVVELCSSSDAEISRDARTILYNFSLENSIKSRLGPALPFLAHAMMDASLEAAELAGATVYSLSVCEALVPELIEKGVVAPLIRLVREGTEKGKRDACKALFNVSLYKSNLTHSHEEVVSKVLEEDGICPLVELLSSPSASLSSKAIHVLRNLTKSRAACAAVAADVDGIPSLVGILDQGLPEAKESAASILLVLAECDPAYRRMVWEEAPMISLELLQRRGTPRARQKAAALLQVLSKESSVSSYEP